MLQYIVTQTYIYIRWNRLEMVILDMSDIFGHMVRNKSQIGLKIEKQQNKNMKTINYFNLFSTKSHFQVKEDQYLTDLFWTYFNKIHYQ